MFPYFVRTTGLKRSPFGQTSVRFQTGKHHAQQTPGTKVDYKSHTRLLCIHVFVLHMIISSWECHIIFKGAFLSSRISNIQWMPFLGELLNNVPVHENYNTCSQCTLDNTATSGSPPGYFWKISNNQSHPMILLWYTIIIYTTIYILLQQRTNVQNTSYHNYHPTVFNFFLHILQLSPYNSMCAGYIISCLFFSWPGPGSYHIPNITSELNKKAQ